MTFIPKPTSAPAAGQPPAARRHLDWRGVVIGGEVIAAGEAGDVADVAAGCLDGLWRASGPGSGRRREELQRNPVWVPEGDARAVMGVHDSAVHDAQLV